AVFVRVSPSPPSRCTTGTVAVGVPLLHLRALLLEVLLLVSLVPEVLVLGVLELLGLVLELLRVLELLEVLEVLELLVVLELLEVLELLGVLELLEVLELLGVLELLEVLELLVGLVLLMLVALLSRACSLLRRLRRLSHHLTLHFARFSTEQPGGLAKRREPASRPVSPVSSGRRVPRQSQPAVSGPPLVVRRPSSPSPRVPLPPPPASSLPVVADPASDRFRAEHSAVTCLLATVVTDLSFESATASALVTELVAFAAQCRLDYAASLVAESASVYPPSVEGECALGTDVLEDRQEDLQCLAAVAPHLVSMLLAREGDPNAPDIPTPRSYAEAIAGEYSSQWQTAMDAEIASWKSTGTYVDEVPPPGANIVGGMWIFRVKRPPGSPPVFKARYVARGFSQ
ncbi:unnamed protein product, partial [Closterium sp. NIES-53]